MAPTTRLVSDLDELGRLAPAWDALADEVDAPVFSRPFWCIPWARHVGSGRPEVAILVEGRDLTGLAPVATRSIAGLELVRFFGHGLGAVSAFLCRPDDIHGQEAIWSAVLGGHRRFAQLLEVRDPAPAPAGPTSFPQESSPRDVCPTIDCSMGLGAYTSARSKKLRENLRRAERSLATRGQHHAVELVTTLDRWLAVRREVIHVTAAAQAVEPRHDVFRGPLASFTDDFIAGSATGGRLRLFIGRIDHEPVSFGIAFAIGTTLSYWMTRFDPRFATASVGVLLLRSIIEHGFAEGFGRVDLLLGDQPHKRRWGTDDYQTLTVVAASNRAVLHAGKTALSAAARVRGHRAVAEVSRGAAGGDTSGAAP